MTAPGMASGDAAQRQPTSFKCTIFVQRLNSILTAGRCKPAGIRQKGTYSRLVKFHKKYGNNPEQFSIYVYNVLQAFPQSSGQ